MRRKGMLIVGIVFIVVGIFLAFIGIQYHYYYWFGERIITDYMFGPISWIGILMFIIGCVFLVLSFLVKEDRSIFSPPYQAYPPPTSQPPAQPYYQAPPPTYQPQQATPPTSPGVRNCISCGKELRPESKYCPWCGTMAR